MSYLDTKTRDELHLCRNIWCQKTSFYQGDFCNSCHELNFVVKNADLHLCRNKWCSKFTTIKDDYCTQCYNIYLAFKYN